VDCPKNNAIVLIKNPQEPIQMERDYSDIKQFMEAIPFACMVMDQKFRIKVHNTKMTSYLPGLERLQNQIDLDLIKVLPQSQDLSFNDFIKKEFQEPNDKDSAVFEYSDTRGRLKKLKLAKMRGFNNSGISNDYFVLGISENFEDRNHSVYTKNLQNKELNPSYEKVLSIYNQASIGIMVLDQDGYVEEINQTFAEQMMFEKKDVIGNQIGDIMSGVLKNKVLHLLQMVKKSELGLVKDVVTIEKGVDDRIILEISMSKFRGNDEFDKKMMMITEDITEQQETHASLLRSEKLALTGRLAASLAHEINNPLQTSIGCLGLVEEMLEEGCNKEDLDVYISMAMDELKRSARIVKKLRDLNRKTDPSEKSCVNLQEIIEDALILTRNRLLDKNIIPVLNYTGKANVVKAAKDQMQQVILNLVINAIDAMPDGGNIYFDINDTESPRGFEIDIRDNGMGISPDVLENLFDPFFTTKEDGLGLGLFICKEIVEDHEGYMEVESREGQGSLFKIWLPGVEMTKEEACL
jgi:PAS domain S-box-containing protein